MPNYIQLDENTFAEEATPDPIRLLTREDFLLIINSNQQEMEAIDIKIADLNTQKQNLQNRNNEIQTLLNN